MKTFRQRSLTLIGHDHSQIVQCAAVIVTQDPIDDFFGGQDVFPVTNGRGDIAFLIKFGQIVMGGCVLFALFAVGRLYQLQSFLVGDFSGLIRLGVLRFRKTMINI